MGGVHVGAILWMGGGLGGVGIIGRVVIVGVLCDWDMVHGHTMVHYDCGGAGDVGMWRVWVLWLWFGREG